MEMTITDLAAFDLYYILIGVILLRSGYSKHFRHSREGGNPGSVACEYTYEWIPAFAGMTVVRLNFDAIALQNSAADWKFITKLR